MTLIPASLMGSIPMYPSIIVAFVIIAQKNLIEMLNGTMNLQKLIYGATTFAVAMCFMFAATTSVLLYFNF